MTGATDPAAAVNAEQRTLAPGPTSSDCGELLDRARDVVLRLLQTDDRLATALRVRVGDVSVEMEWLTQDTPAAGPAPVVGQAAAEERPGDGEAPSAGYLTAHTVGCFYRCPGPGAAPFVAEGDVVSAGKQVAIIEAMKLMLPVEVERDCRIGAVLVADGQTVEYGDRLFALESLGSG